MEGRKISHSGCQNWRYELGVSCAKYSKGGKRRSKRIKRWQTGAVLLLSTATQKVLLSTTWETCSQPVAKP